MQGKGRHDPCVVPRAVPIVESMAALVIADFYLRKRNNKFKIYEKTSAPLKILIGMALGVILD